MYNDLGHWITYSSGDYSLLFYQVISR